MINKSWTRLLALVLPPLLALSLSACNDSGGGNDESNIDFGDNDPNQVVCVGDSITEGRCVPAGDPYPARLDGLSDKNVANEGRCGERSGEGASRIGSVLNRHNPGYIIILYGANDAIFGYSVDQVLGNLRNICNAAIANKTVPILMTCTPTYDGHAFAAGRLQEYSAAIRNLGKELKIKVVDLEKEFGNERSFIQGDGLHPSDTGTALIALAAKGKI